MITAKLLIGVAFWGLVMMLTVPACGKAASTPSSVPTATYASVTGTVTYLEKISLPAGATIEVKLLAVSKAGSHAVTIGEKVITTTGQQVPFPFNIKYDPALIDSSYTYVVQASITIDGKLWFMNDTQYQVITRGNSSAAEMVLKQTTVPTPAQSGNIIIDHTNWDWYNSQPQQVFDRVAMQKIYFAHASVGRNILEGFSELHNANPSKYPLGQTSAGETPPSLTSEGTIYEYIRGNPGWSEKVSDFEIYINNGWHDTMVDMVINKLCYIDQNADWTAYRDSMIALETKYPSTKFVYWTMPITTADDSEAMLRNQFNQNLRNWIATQNNKLLFDIADIEAWSPSGEHQTFTYNGTVYERMFPAYTSDGGHLNTEGSQRMATGLYSLFGRAINPVQFSQ